jgi:hypothetical protein
MASTSSSLEILSMAAIPFAANYSLEFSGPSLSCAIAPVNITRVIHRVADYTSSIIGDRLISFLAFAPQDELLYDSGENYRNYEDYADSCIGPNSTVNYGGFYCLGMAALFQNYSGSSPYIWVKPDADYYSCELKDTLFNVTFNATGNIQTINHPYEFQVTDQPVNRGYYIHGQVMTNWLGGVVWGMFDGLSSARTHLLETSLYAALETGNTRDSAHGQSGEN